MEVHRKHNGNENRAIIAGTVEMKRRRYQEQFSDKRFENYGIMMNFQQKKRQNYLRKNRKPDVSHKH